MSSVVVLQCICPHHRSAAEWFDGWITEEQVDYTALLLVFGYRVHVFSPWESEVRFLGDQRIKCKEIDAPVGSEVHIEGFSLETL